MGLGIFRGGVSQRRNVDASNGNRPTNARDRIGEGPWYKQASAGLRRTSPSFTRAPVTPTFHRRAREPYQRSVDRFSTPTSMTFDGVRTRMERWQTGATCSRLDVRIGERHRTSRTLGRHGPQPEHDSAVELPVRRTREPELREHRTPRGAGHLLLRPIVVGGSGLVGGRGR